MTDLSARIAPEGAAHPASCEILTDRSAKSIRAIGFGGILPIYRQRTNGSAGARSTGARTSPRPIQQVVHHLDQAAQHEGLGHPCIGLKLFGRRGDIRDR